MIEVLKLACDEISLKTATDAVIEKQMACMFFESKLDNSVLIKMYFFRYMFSFHSMWVVIYHPPVSSQETAP